MKAMVLAAGLGTRLGELTRKRPKALMEVAGYTLMEITLRRLRGFGITEVIVNVYHCAEMVVEYLRAHDDFGMRIAISREDELLDTGGGLKKAACFFLKDKASDEPFILHNVDVLSSIDLGAMVRVHRENHALATLAVQQRESSRTLLFDDRLTLCGRRRGTETEMARPATKLRELAFAGIHVISPRVFKLMDGGDKPQAFSIIDEYLRLAGFGERIIGFQTDDSYWRDLGTPESLQQAAKDVSGKLIEI